jgi:hypothetical protein
MAVAFASATTSPTNGIVVGCNPDTTISRADLDFDDSTELTYTGGDHTSLTTINPDGLTGLQAIFPSHCTYGMDTQTVSSYSTPHCLVYDSTEAAWCYMVYRAQDQSIMLFGSILEPSADANTYGTAQIYGAISTTTGYGGIAHTQAEVNAFDTLGASQDYDISVSNTLDGDNYIVSGGADDGKLNWRRVDVINGTGGAGIKGTLKPQICCETGIYRDGRFFQRPIDFGAYGPVVRYTESCAVFWEEGARIFPSYAVNNP